MQGPAPVSAATTRRHTSVEEEAEGGRAKVLQLLRKLQKLQGRENMKLLENRIRKDDMEERMEI